MQQQLMLELLREIREAGPRDGSPRSHGTDTAAAVEVPSIESAALRNYRSPGTDSAPRSAIASVAPPHAVNLLSSQVPEYGGSKDEDVRLWVQRVEDVSAIHGASPEVTLLAASNKLIKTARRWFDIGSGPMLQSWAGLRKALIKRFARKIPFCVAMQKIEARKWEFARESFQEYAMDKLVLMHSLNLPVEDAIHLLINGITSRSLRETAASLKDDSIDQFLNDMDRITTTIEDRDRKTVNTHIKVEKAKYGVAKKGQTDRPTKDLICNYCKIRGHKSGVLQIEEEGAGDSARGENEYIRPCSSDQGRRGTVNSRLCTR